MADLKAQKTLVKSTPELWAELSEVESLARHLGELGEIRITKVEPETTVAWEGEQVSGTVELEQSGWGTRVTFRATVPEPEADADPPEAATGPEPEAADPIEPVAEAEPEREAVAGPDPATVELEAEPEPVATEPRPERLGFFKRWLFKPRGTVVRDVVEHEPESAVEAAAAEREAPAATAVEHGPLGDELSSIAAGLEPEALDVVAAEPEPISVALGRVELPGPEPEAAVSVDAERVREVLNGTLEALGQAHHRPFSRG